MLAAHLEVTPVWYQWINMDFTLAAEAADNSAPFSSTARPSSRSLTTAQITHSSDAPWTPGEWYALNDMATAVQEVVNRPGWQTGNSLTVILHGTGPTWGRKYVRSYESDPALAVRLVITYAP